MLDTTSRNAWDLGPSFGMRRTKDELMMSSSTRTSTASPKSATNGPRIIRSFVIDK
jgi:hypothetical protein